MAETTYGDYISEVKVGGVNHKLDATKLNGQDVNYYATASSLESKLDKSKITLSGTTLTIDLD